MLEDKLLWKYCDLLLKALYNKSPENEIIYGEYEYRDESPSTQDFFVKNNISAQYATAVIKILHDNKFINLHMIGRSIYRPGIVQEKSKIKLSEEGEHFYLTNSFERQYENSERKNESDRVNFENTKVSLAVNKWLLRTKWLPHIFSIVGIAWGVFIFVDAKKDSNKQKIQIEGLQTKLQATKSEIYKRLDSVYRTTHTANTTKKK